MLLHQILHSFVLLLLQFEKVNFNFLFLLPCRDILFEMVLNEALDIPESVVKLLWVLLDFISQIIDGMFVYFIHFLVLCGDQEVGVKFIGFSSEGVTGYFDQRHLFALSFRHRQPLLW